MRACKKRKAQNKARCIKVSLNPLCSNCKREKSDALQFRKLSVKEINLKKTWALCKDIQEHGMFCHLCFNYLTNRSEGRSENHLIWPAFFRKLMDEKWRQIEFVWKFIPHQWRRWWIRYVQTFQSSYRITLDFPRPMIEDVTLTKKTLDHMLSNLNCTTWSQLKHNWEKYNSIPIVRCPWGCSEFLSKVNFLPFDVFVETMLDESISKYTKNAGAKGSIGYRKDLMSKRVEILHNPSWKCSLCIYVDTDSSPKLLCCRYHNERSQGQYVHPPTSPCGSLTFKGDNSFSQVVANPRTIKSFKLGKHTSSYHLNKVMGNYSGIDTINVTDHLSSAQNPRTEESLTKDLLAIRCRADYRQFTVRMAKLKRSGLAKNALFMLKQSQELWSESTIIELKKYHCKGSTYMNIQDATDLDFLLRNESTREIIEEQNQQKTMFHARWPRRMLYLNNPLSSHGQHFPCFKSNYKSLPNEFWLLINMCHMVPSIWKSLDDKVKTDMSWEGWMLTFLTSQVLPMRLDGRSAGKNFFPVSAVSSTKKYIELLTAQTDDDSNRRSFSKTLKYLFKHHETIGIVASQHDKPNAKSHEIVLLCSSFTQNQIKLPISFQKRFLPSHLVCFIGTKNEIFVRHTDRGDRSFWKYDTKGRHERIYDTQEELLNDKQIKKNWVCVVFKQRYHHDLVNIRNTILELQGGQSNISCKAHGCPLVISALRNKPCVGVADCTKKVNLDCPIQGCKIGLCKRCEQNMIQTKQTHECFNVRGIDHISDEEQSNDHFHSSNESVSTEVSTSENDTSVEYGSKDGDSFRTPSLDSRESQYFLGTSNFCGNSNDDESVSFSISTASSNPIEPENVMCGYEELDDPAFDLMECDIEDCREELEIPTTNSGKIAARFNVTSLAKQGRLVSNHVLLNQSGSLLLRRHAKLRGNRCQRNFLQRIVSTSSQYGTVPLIYPEAMLFPNIFWASVENDSMVGAIPNAFWKDNSTLKKLGIASLYDHLRTRMLDPSLQTHTNTVYHYFAWDQLANLGLRGHNTELVLRRGWAEMNGYEGIQMRDKEDPVYDEQMIDTRATINQLSAANARQQVDLFFTWTNNQTDTFGCRKIAQWINSDEAIERVLQNGWNTNNVSDRLNDSIDAEDAKKSLQIGAATMSIRCWLETVQVFLRYLQFGLDSPFRNICGGISEIFNRLEFQENLDSKPPHCHTLLYFNDHPKNEAEANDILELIRGCPMSFISKKDEITLMKQDMLTGDSFDDLLADMKIKLRHHCTKRCLIPTIAKNGDVVRTCKAPNNAKMNPDSNYDYFMPIHINHQKDALKIMEELGLIRINCLNHGTFEVDEKYKHLFEAKRHIPKCNSLEVKYSPTNTTLFCMTRSAQNLQYCTSYMILRYLAKYVAGIDKAQRVSIKSERDADHQYKIEEDDANNTKITSNAILDNKKRAENKNDNFEMIGRHLPQGDVFMQIFRYPKITTSTKFKFIPTQPMELRSMKFAPKKIKKMLERKEVHGQPNFPSDLDSLQVFPNQKARELLKFPKERHFDDFQVMSYKDSLFQPGAVDTVTLFGLRCPELKWMKRLPKYVTYFEFVAIKDYEEAKTCADKAQILSQMLHIDLQLCPWIDSLGRRAYVRINAIPKILKILSNYRTEHILEDFGNEENYLMTKNLFFKLKHDVRYENDPNQKTTTYLVNRFVYEQNQEPTKLPIYWYRCTRATSFEAFTYHLLMSMGSFNTELELMSVGNMKKAFIMARLFTASEDEHIQRESCTNLLKKYVTSQLAHLPAGSRTFDKELITSSNLLHNFLLHDKILSSSMPSTLYTNLKQQCAKEAEEEISKIQTQLMASTLNKLSKVYDQQELPTPEQIRKCTKMIPFNFNFANLSKPREQSKRSYEEHKIAHQLIQKLVAHYKQGSDERTKSVCFLGPGGVGKTTVMHLACIHCMCQGLNVLSTTLTGKRSAENAGLHLHALFMIPIHDNSSPANTSEKAMKNLLKNPKQWEILRRVDVFLIDELGQIDAKLLTILDMIMRRLRHSNHFFGGVPIISTMDIKQLRPIKGLPPLLSPSMICSVVFHKFETVLRTHDVDMQRIQSISRIPPHELISNQSKLLPEFTTLLGKTCNFVDSIDDENIPSNSMYCFTKNAACQKAQQKIISKLQQKHQKVATNRLSEDFEETRLQKNPVPASETTKLLLDRQSTKLPRDLWFFPYAVYEFTYNHPERLFMKSQICMILKEVPSRDTLDKWKEFTVYAAPCGINASPKEKPTEAELLKQGWKKVKVGMHKERTVQLKNNGLRGKRLQYALRPYISSTVHSIMGSTVENLVVQIGTNPELALWEPAQVVVILSRTKSPKHLFFVGKKDNVIRSLWNALTAKDQFTDYINYLERSVTNQNNGINFTINQAKMHPFRSKYLPLPPQGERLVYLLVSSKQMEITYIGWTNNLARRINQHNSSIGGSTVTNDINLQPFCCVGYVVGFDSTKSVCAFESKWKHYVESGQIISKGNLTWQQKLHLVNNIANEHKMTYNEKLTLITLGFHHKQQL